MPDTVGRKPPIPPVPAQPQEFTAIEFCILVGVCLIICGGIVLSVNAVRDHARVKGEAWAMTYEELADRARVKAQQVRNALESQRLAGTLPTPTPTPVPVPKQPYYQYATLQSIEEVNVWCADPRYGWRLVGTTRGGYVLERIIK